MFNINNGFPENNCIRIVKFISIGDLSIGIYRSVLAIISYQLKTFLNVYIGDRNSVLTKNGHYRMAKNVHWRK